MLILSDYSIVSLGACCETSFVIKRLFKDQMYTCFDWLSIHNLVSIKNTFYSDFKNFTINDTQQTVIWKSSDGSILNHCKLADYDIHQVHNVTNKTLQRRVIRLKELLTDSKPILFILKCHLPYNELDQTIKCNNTPYLPNITMEEAIGLRDSIHTLRKNNFKLLIVNEFYKYKQNESYQNIEIKWIIGQPIKGDAQNSNIIVPCDYATTQSYINQWFDILTDTLNI
jgi:hypothetical protein